MHYKIKQINNYDDCIYLFDPWCVAEGTFDLKRDYETIYEGEIEYDDEGNTVEDVNGVLEKLFHIFNLEHPEDYKGRSLSVSDVVELNGVNYYCDNVGWHELED